MTKEKDIKTVVPALQFPEFRDADGWEVVQLGKVCDVIGGGTPDTKEDSYWNGDIPWISSSDICEGNISKINYKRYITQDAIKNSATKLCEAPSIHIVSRVGVGKIAFSTINICTSQDFTNLCNIKSSYVFLSYLLSIIMKQKTQETQGTSIKGITSAEIKNFSIQLPTIKEQEKIADCLGSLDDLISAVADKIEVLKEHKKGLMQQLFPAEGKTTPALRFSEFQNAGEWRETTLVKLAKFRRGSFPQPYGLPEWFDENGMPFIQVYDVDDNMLLKPQTKSKISELAAKQSVFIPKETVIITIQGSIGRVAITQYDAYIDRTLLLFEEFYKPLNKVFFAYILQLLFDIEKQKAPGGIIKTITKEVLSDFKVNMPNIDEQQKIANCLSSIDKLISADIDKLDQLKAHKKGLMQQLFPTLNE